MRKLFLTILTVSLLLAVLVPAAALAADLAPPWNGEPVSPGLGPTYGEPWPVAVPADEAAAALQTPPLAIMPYAAIGPVLAQIQSEASAAGLPHRMDWWVTGKSAGGRDLYAVVINDLETDWQQRDYDRWQVLRSKMLSNPQQAKTLIANWRGKVKMPIYIEADINGTEYEGTDAMMQVIRDLTTTPYGENKTVDKLLDHCILVVVPTSNPDGRVMGIRGNAGVADTNRDYFLQSQPEEQIDAAIQQQWLAPGALHMHGYVTPTLIDGLTIPHNPGLQYDIFAKWNQARTAQNKTDFNAMGLEIQRPVNDWDGQGDYLATGHSTQIAMQSARNNGATEVGTTVTIVTTVPHELAVGDSVTVAGVSAYYGGYNGTFTVTGVPSATSFTYESTPGLISPLGGGYVWSPKYGPGEAPGPAVAQSWDDWGPFYGQTYMAFLGVDSSTVEMSNATRLVSKTAQYMAFYSSADYWLENAQAFMSDQMETFRRGVTNAAKDPDAISKVPSLVELGFTDAIHNWMVDFPKAYIIPFGAGQRSDAEANRVVEWLLANNIKVDRARFDFAWGGTTYKAGSYIVSMSQALRGLAWNALAPGTDIIDRIQILYASPAAWSHGLLWGADTVEVPRDAAFAPKTAPVSTPNALTGGIRGGMTAKADWYSVSIKGVRAAQAILGALKDGVTGELAEAAFTSTTGGAMPAGTLIFPADATTAAKLDAAGKQAGFWVERNVKVAKPATSKVGEAPRIAVLTTSGAPLKTIGPTTYFMGADTDGVLRRLFGPLDQYVTYVGANALQSSASDPLANIDVIVNAGAGYPAATNTTARARLSAFFARGGGYIGQSSSGSNFTFLTNGGLVTGLTQTTQPAYGGIAVWKNVAGSASPISGAYPAADYMFLPSNVTYFSAVPADAIVDGRYPSTIATPGAANGWISGMWLDRNASANDAPVLIHGDTTAHSRYVAYSTNPFSRYDAEREWPLIVQAALWSDLTDDK